MNEEPTFIETEPTRFIYDCGEGMRMLDPTKIKAFSEASKEEQDQMAKELGYKKNPEYFSSMVLETYNFEKEVWYKCRYYLKKGRNRPKAMDSKKSKRRQGKKILRKFAELHDRLKRTGTSL